MYKKLLLVVFFLALSYSLIGAQTASGVASGVVNSASAPPASSLVLTLSPSAPNTVNLTTQAPFTPSPSPLPGSATALSTPIVSSLVPTAFSRNPSASPLESGTVAPNSESAASPSTAASTGASNSESAASTGASNSGSAASTGASNSESAASASSVASTGASNSGSAASTGASNSESAASNSGAASASQVAASASNSPVPAPSPTYNCYCDWYEIPSIQKVPDTNSSYDYSNYAPGTLFYGQQLSTTLNFMAIASTQAMGGAGIVDVFTRFANFPFWTKRVTLTPTTTNSSHYFGSYVSILNDANVLVIETNPRPRFYSFERSAPATWIQVQPNFLLNVARVTAMDARGTLMVIAYRVGIGGAVAIYNKIGYTWTLVTNFTNPEGGNIFYSQVSIGAGNIFAAVTSNSQGSVHVFTKTNAGTWNSPQVVSNDPTGAAYFGAQLRTVAMSADRGTLVVGSTASIWLMSAFGNRTFPANVNQVTSYDTEANSAQFVNVNNIRLSGNLMAVSDNQISPASLSRSTCTPSATTGAVFVYNRSGNNVFASSVFRPESQDDAFGNSLALSTNQGNIIIAGGSVDTVYTFIEQGDVAIPQACSTNYEK